MRLEDIKKTFSDYFHPESLWKQGNIGKAKAIGAVISWGTLVLPIIMGIGLAISTSRLQDKVKNSRAISPGTQDAISNKVNITFERANLTSEEESDSSKAKPNIIITKVNKNNAVSPGTQEKRIDPTQERKSDLSTAKANIIPSSIEPELYEKLNKKFISKILNSNFYSPLEKEKLFVQAKIAYTNTAGVLLSPTSWVPDVKTTVAFLKWFAVKRQPNYSTIPGIPGQFDAKTLESKIGLLLSKLPLKIDQGPRVYGHPIRVDGAHRTGFVIDMDNKTVEYFNSFGEDYAAREPLTALAKALTQKYEVNFSYHHRTANIRLQPDEYQCGIWTCKLIEERFKQGKKFDPASLRDFDIAQYRNKVLAKAHKLHFYQEVGKSRYYTYLRQNLNHGDSESVLNKKICDSLGEKFHQPGEHVLDSIWIEWGRKPQSPVPDRIKNLVQSAKNNRGQ